MTTTTHTCDGCGKTIPFVLNGEPAMLKFTNIPANPLAGVDSKSAPYAMPEEYGMFCFQCHGILNAAIRSTIEELKKQNHAYPLDGLLKMRAELDQRISRIKKGRML